MIGMIYVQCSEQDYITKGKKQNANDDNDDDDDDDNDDDDE